MRLYEFVITVIAIAVFIVGMSFGLDREMARRDFEKAVHNGDFERPIIGCLWDYNCEYYTQMLYDSID